MVIFSKVNPHHTRMETVILQSNIQTRGSLTV